MEHYDIHRLKNLAGLQSHQGANPFERLNFGNQKFSSIVRAYDPSGVTSQDVYAWIRRYLPAAVEEAIQIRSKY